MGSLTNIIDLVPNWQIAAIIIGLPLVAIGLFHLLKFEFRNRSASSLSGFLTILSLVLVQNEIKIHYYLNTSEAGKLIQESGQLWDYLKYRKSYEKMEQAIRVASYQEDDPALIAAYETLTDRYFNQSNYQNPISYTEWEIKLLENASKFLKQKEPYDVTTVEGDDHTSFYKSLYNIDVTRNDPFADSIYYLSSERLAPTNDHATIKRAVFQRALTVITQSIEAGDTSIPPSLLGKLYAALSGLEENRGNFTQAFEYIQQSIQHWNDNRAKLHAARLAFKLEKDTAAHALIDDIQLTHVLTGRQKDNERFVLEAAMLEFKNDNLERARQIYVNLQNQLQDDLNNYQMELEQVNRDHLASLNASNSLIYPFLRNVRDIRQRIDNIDDHLENIRSRYVEKARIKKHESERQYYEEDFDSALATLYEALELAEKSEKNIYQYMYHLSAAKMLNMLERFKDAEEHIFAARDVHDGNNDILINTVRENDIALIYPALLVAQLGNKQFNAASDTLEILQTIGISRDYNGALNNETFAYLKGRVLYFIATGEKIRAQIYLDDAINYLIENADKNEIPLSFSSDIGPMEQRNIHEKHMVDLLSLARREFKQFQLRDFQAGKTQQY